MTYIKHYAKVISHLFSSTYSYKKFSLFLDYVVLVINSFIHHKISKRINNNACCKFLGFNITFDDYGQLIDMIEEIFIYQVYKFESVRNTPTIIDCGSNIGISVLFFKRLYPSAIIYAFEPDKKAFDLLERNIHENNLTEVFAFNIALTKHDGEVMLYRSHHEGLLNTRLFYTAGSTAQGAVQSARLTNYISEPVDLLKIDVEGSELAIIEDLMENQKIRFAEQMIIEYHLMITLQPVENFIKQLKPFYRACTVSNDILHTHASELLIRCTN
ncbi:FkbM family methyltransferase [Chryseosolibacter indicus]|uniref:FkbM family methyltransferase n=1 Tax=Chryseosolibacter indicus TaxID=2782351 RepID=A0ABS5VN00_9BACT|nr:FkbM family methyltransferase [Chryseosolibacter indicus]MBT1702224.1 FkbM family methyltransferase [Chryseosolibacter indicus]